MSICIQKYIPNLARKGQNIKKLAQYIENPFWKNFNCMQLFGTGFVQSTTPE